jgi:hypothetical protein
MQKIYIKDKLYIPQTLIPDLSLLQKHWDLPVFDESLCKRCDNRPHRINNQCRICPGLQRIVRMWAVKEGNNGLKYYTLPCGQIKHTLARLNIDISNVQFEDLRVDLPFIHPLKFTGTLRRGEFVNGVPTANQEYLVQKWLETGYGLIEAPPRTGKTVLGTYLSCFLQKKTIITAHQEELLMNFYKTYVNMTNLKELQEQTGKHIVKVIQKIEDFEREDYDVILVNYQKFIRSSGEERIEKYLKSKFAFVIVDECHQGAAECFSKFLHKLAPKYTLGLSATPKRKDCVEERTQIYTEQGVMSMGDLVDLLKQGQKIRVYSKNLETNEIELKPILEVHEKYTNRVKKALLSNRVSLLTTTDHFLY